MSRTRVTIDPNEPRSLPPGRVDPAVLDGTTEEDIARQAGEDNTDAMEDLTPETTRKNQPGSRWSGR